MKKHLAIFTKEAAEEIFSGRKTIETRFSQKRIPPFGEVSVGDIVYIKVRGGEVEGQFKVKRIIFFEGLDKTDWKLIRDNYGKDLSLGSSKTDANYFKDKESSKYGTLIFIDRVEQFITSPIKVEKHDQRGWMVLV